MATTPASPDTGTYGVSETITGITIESLNVTESPQTEPVPDQVNATANEIVYDTRKELRLTYRGTKLTVSGGKVTFVSAIGGSTVWAVDSHEDAGTYNGLKRYTLVAHRFDNFPSAS